MVQFVILPKIYVVNMLKFVSSLAPALPNCLNFLKSEKRYILFSFCYLYKITLNGLHIWETFSSWGPRTWPKWARPRVGPIPNFDTIFSRNLDAKL